MPNGEGTKRALCPICDYKVNQNEKKCPECKADLTVFGIKMEGDVSADVKIPEYKESLDELLGEIGKKDEKKEHELFEEIMAAVDKTDSISDKGAETLSVFDDVKVDAEKVEEKSAETVMFECPICNTLVGEEAKSCPGCNAVFADDEEEVSEGDGIVEQAAAAPSMEEKPMVKEDVGEVKQPPAAPPIEEKPMVKEDISEVKQAPAAPPIEEKPVIDEVKPEAEKVKAPPIEMTAETAPPKVKDKKRGKPPKRMKGRRFAKRKDKGKVKAPGKIPSAPPSDAPSAPPVDAPPAPPVKAPPAPPITAQPPQDALRDEKSLRRELGVLVAEVKPLLTGAKQVGINILEGRKWIDDAITAGKKKDFDRAITLVKESKNAMHNAINQHTMDVMRTIQMKIDVLKKAGTNVNELENSVLNIKSLLNEERYIEAATLAKKITDSAEKSVMISKKGSEISEQIEEDEDPNDMIKVLINMIQSGEKVNVNTKNTKTLLTQARLAMKKSQMDEARALLVKSKEDFLKELTKKLTDIVSNSKPVLYTAKMAGMNIRPSIKLLREASTALKQNKYLDALETIKHYKTMMKQYINED